MYKYKILQVLALFLFSLLFSAPESAFAATVVLPPEDVNISAIVSGTTATPPPPGGGGGYTNVSSVVFSGIAYPFARVYILKNGQIVQTVTADFFARFTATLYNLPTNVYKFGVYAEDGKGRTSVPFTFPLSITYGTMVRVDNIYLSPTISLNKTEVIRGENIVISGQSAPRVGLSLVVGSNTLYAYGAIADILGQYSYTLNTAPLALGFNQAKSRATINGQLTAFTLPLRFLVSEKKKDIAECTTIRGDLNCDGKVNLIDFSIMAYWYKKPNPPALVDLNSDGVISLSDFSILAFCWTG